MPPLSTREFTDTISQLMSPFQLLTLDTVSPSRNSQSNHRIFNTYQVTILLKIFQCFHIPVKIKFILFTVTYLDFYYDLPSVHFSDVYPAAFISRHPEFPAIFQQAGSAYLCQSIMCAALSVSILHNINVSFHMFPRYRGFPLTTL